MSLFAKQWLGTWNGHRIEVHQRTGHQYLLVIDGERVESDTSLINIGKRFLKATIQHEGTGHLVKVQVDQGLFTESASVTIDDVALPMEKS